MRSIYLGPLRPILAQLARTATRYDRNDPTTARVDSFVDLWLLPLIFIPLGLLFGLIYNLYVLFQFVRRMRSA